MFASRLSRISPSPTLAMTARASALKAQGIDILSLSAGEPDFETPDFIKEAASEAMAQGITRYTPVEGLVDLKKAIQSKFLRENNLSYELEEIIVSTGAKQVIFNALLATVEEGDEVLIPAPYWVSYPDIVQLAEGTPVFLTCSEEKGFKITPPQLEEAITPRAKWLILNSPSNPTGAVYSREELLALGQILLKHPQVWILSDDIYEHLIFDGKFSTLADVEPALKERTLTVNGFSKAYAMTGWRLGYGAGSKALIKAMSILQSQSTSNACSISQAAAIKALSGPQDFLAQWREIFKKRRDFVVNELKNIPGLSCITPQGAFYIYVHCGSLLGKRALSSGKERILSSDEDVVEYLLEEARVALVGGSAFGLSPYFRISISTSENILLAAMNRIKEAVLKLSV